MKIQLNATAKKRDGAALVLTAIILVFVGSVLATYMLVSQNEYAMVSRSQTWANSMAMTEAGVEDALAFINKYQGNFAMVTNWSTAASAAEDGWTINGTTYTMHRVVNAKGDCYDANIDNSIPSSPVVTSAGKANFSLTSAQPPFMFAAAGLQVAANTTAVSRKIQVNTVYSPLFPGAITCGRNISFNGNNVRVDSFDSTLTNASRWVTNWGYGLYNVSIARANGNVATGSDITGAISVQQANIFGRVDTGPGGTSTVGNNGYVGSLPLSGSGIQPGYSADDMNMVFPDVTLPAGARGWQSISGNTISASGNYYCMGINNSLTINAANVTIFVDGDINISGLQSIDITNASRVVMYVSGNISLNGQATVNNWTENAGVFGIYGLPTCTSIDLTGNADFTGMIYAPEADYGFGGGGRDTQDMTGALVSRSCNLNGKAKFHYDESLKRNGPGIGYIPFSWKEITGN